MATVALAKTDSRVDRFLSGLKGVGKRAKEKLAEPLAAYMGGQRNIREVVDRRVWIDAAKELGPDSATTVIAGLPAYDLWRQAGRVIESPGVRAFGGILFATGVRYGGTVKKSRGLHNVGAGLQGGFATMLRLSLLAKDHPIRIALEEDTKAFRSSVKKPEAAAE